MEKIEKYFCIKNYKFDSTGSYLKGNYYEFINDTFLWKYDYTHYIFFPTTTFDAHFISFKEIRKQKLEKLNEKISLY